MIAERVDVWGTFDVANLGDLLFPLVLERELRERGCDLPLRAMSPHGGEMPLGVCRAVTRIATAAEPGFAEQAKAAGIVLGGGDILRVLPAPAAGLVPGASGFYRYDPFVGELAVLAAATRVVWNGVGVPSRFEPAVAAVVRLLAGRSRYVSVRDAPSRALLEEAGVDREIAVVPDPAFVADRLFAQAELAAAIEGLRNRGEYPRSGPVLAFHVSFTDHDEEHECARSLRALVDSRPGLQIALVPIGPCHGDVARMSSLAGAIGSAASAITGQVTVVDLVAAVAGADAFIGSSLHGNIVAARFGVPGAFLTLPSQRPHKLSACSEYLGRECWNIDTPAEIARTGGLLLDGEAPVDRDRLARLAVRVDRHYDELSEALLGGELPPRAVELDRAPAWTTRAAAGVDAAERGRALHRESRPDLAALRALLGAHDDHGSESVFAFDRMAAAMLHERPYKWGVVGDVFAPADQRSLFDSYPVEPFATIAGYDGEKGYEYEARSLVAMGGVAPWRPDLLSEPWFRLATDLCSRRYREALSAITGVDLDGLVMEANLFHYGRGSWLGPHVDLPEKVLTHVLYFNPEWNPRDGGCLRVLASGREADVIAEVPPLAGTSVVLVRSDASWHAVTPVVPTCEQTRRSVTVTFYPRGAVSTMWPPSAPRSLHRYPPVTRAANATAAASRSARS